jgi:hypothetical protein
VLAIPDKIAETQKYNKFKRHFPLCPSMMEVDFYQQPLLLRDFIALGYGTMLDNPSNKKNLLVCMAKYAVVSYKGLLLWKISQFKEFDYGTAATPAAVVTELPCIISSVRNFLADKANAMATSRTWATALLQHAATPCDLQKIKKVLDDHDEFLCNLCTVIPVIESMRVFISDTNIKVFFYNWAHETAAQYLRHVYATVTADFVRLTQHAGAVRVASKTGLSISIKADKRLPIIFGLVTE